MNEHDKLFKEIESIRENAADLISSTFPKEILQELDLDTLVLDSNSYVDTRLQEHYTDLVYNCHSGNNAQIKISLLFEHKSYKPSNEYLQLLRYMVNMWSYQEKNNHKLSLIIPVIFYHGKEKWDVKPFSDFFPKDTDKMHRFLPQFTYLLTDIARYDDDTIKRRLFRREYNRVLALLFKYINNESLLIEKLYDILVELKEYIDNEQEHARIRSFITYIMKLTEISPQQFMDVANKVSEKGGNIVMTTAMKLKEEGIEQGIEQGERHKAIESARSMLKDGIPVQQIAKYTGLSVDEIESLKV